MIKIALTKVHSSKHHFNSWAFNNSSKGFLGLLVMTVFKSFLDNSANSTVFNIEKATSFNPNFLRETRISLLAQVFC